MNRRSAILLSTIAPFARAADPWKQNKPGEWSVDDVKKLITRSPWSKEVSVSMGMGMGSGGGMGRGGGRKGGGGGGGMPGGGGGMGGPGGGGGGGMEDGPGGGMGGMGGGGGMNSMPEIKATVRWESSQVMYDATKRPKSAQSEKFYILTVSGLRPMGGGGMRGGEARSAPSATDPAQRRQMMLERMKQSTTLERKGKDPIFADVVESRDAGPAPVYYFAFSKEKQAIALEDKEVTLHLKLGPMELKAKFVLKEMVYQGQLAL